MVEKVNDTACNEFLKPASSHVGASVLIPVCSSSTIRGLEGTHEAYFPKFSNFPSLEKRANSEKVWNDLFQTLEGFPQAFFAILKKKVFV